ncbi:MAG TPA: DUF4058 family protein [Tepidisphaeraceae bacterium]|nr:DUF4058 family protein [Tepidisphaeraceae bacterium]
MPGATLQDHFRPPLSLRRHWHAFHNAWATYLASDLNALLPDGYFAESNVQFGIEIDVAAFDESRGSSWPGAESTATWTAPAPVQSIPFAMSEETVEVLLYDSREGPLLAGAIELVSPGNKDRSAARDAFVSKCETYLQSSAGLLIVDVVTDRRGSLHDQLIKRLHPDAFVASVDLYAAGYRPICRDDRTMLDVWHEPLALNRSLPTMPLWLRGDLCLPVDLAASYDRTCREQRILQS